MPDEEGHFTVVKCHFISKKCHFSSVKWHFTDEALMFHAVFMKNFDLKVRLKDAESVFAQ